jgi:hypothetical protein
MPDWIQEKARGPRRDLRNQDSGDDRNCDDNDDKALQMNDILTSTKTPDAANFEVPGTPVSTRFSGPSLCGTYAIKSAWLEKRIPGSWKGGRRKF